LPNSPVKRVGSDLSSDFPEVQHTIPVLSLDKVHNIPDLVKWTEKIQKLSETDNLTVIMEEKIDGVSIVLYYRDGVLEKAVTRGNGEKGNDVTANVKTIGAVPLQLNEKATGAVRGEIYLPLDKFNVINQSLKTKFANPRNLAAGTIRRIKSSEVSKVPLNIFVYEGFFDNIDLKYHHEILAKLDFLGFRINKNTIAFSNSKSDMAKIKKNFPFLTVCAFSQIESYILKKSEERKHLGYEIDGLVIKIDSISDRDKYGYTGHHPRWAIAYKFEFSESESVVKSIDIQIGRTGRATPVARIEPVEISGSIISNVTLHNQDYIDFLMLSPGDRVTVSKRGDVIPAIENVVEKSSLNKEVWKMDKNCPSCGSLLVPEGAHLFCKNELCSERIKGQILFFASKDQMNIENLGNETIELLVNEKIIKNVFDIYTTDISVLKNYEGYAEKKINLIKEGIEKSKSRSFKTVLSSLGIPEIGPKVCEILIKSGINSIDIIYNIAESNDMEKLLSKDGIGEKTAESFFKYFNDKNIRATIKKLADCGLPMKEENSVDIIDSSFSGQSWCVTGSFDNFKPRILADNEIKKRGGAVVTQLSGKTTHLLCGDAPGSKYDKALKLGIKIVKENEFIDLLKK
jgi:DNA ligase (NAD+)